MINAEDFLSATETQQNPVTSSKHKQLDDRKWNTHTEVLPAVKVHGFNLLFSFRSFLLFWCEIRSEDTQQSIIL